MVVIVDPHIKRTQDYPVYKEAQELDLFIKNKHGSEFEGWCWSGSSAWIDFFNPNSWEWYKSLYKFNGREDGKWSWTESTGAVHIWNDMNEVQSHFSSRSAWPVLTLLLFSAAVYFQRAGNHDGKGFHSLRRLGTPGCS